MAEGVGQERRGPRNGRHRHRFGLRLGTYPIRPYHLEKALSGVVAEEFVVADIVGQDLERLVSADLLHLEHRRALSRRLGQESGA